MIKPKPRYTHYSYVPGANYHREPTGLFDLSLQGPIQRRAFIDRLFRNKEFLAAVPYEGIKGMDDIRSALAAIADRKRDEDFKRRRPKYD